MKKVKNLKPVLMATELDLELETDLIKGEFFKMDDGKILEVLRGIHSDGRAFSKLFEVIFE